MTETPETPEAPIPPPSKRLSDDDYVRVGKREIIVGIILLIGGAAAYWQYRQYKTPVMDHGVVQLTHKLPGDDEYSFVQGPEGTQAEVIENSKTKDGAQQLKIRVSLEEGAALEPGTYDVVVGTASGNESKASFTVKVEQKK